VSFLFLLYLSEDGIFSVALYFLLSPLIFFHRVTDSVSRAIDPALLSNLPVALNIFLRIIFGEKTFVQKF
jgi:hypothetical protein